MLRHLVPIAAAALLLLIVLAAAVPLYHWFEEPAAPPELPDKLDLWRSYGFDSYQFVIEKHCDCGPPGNIPVRVIVRDSLAIAVFDDRGTYDPRADKIEGVPASIPLLFEIARSGKEGSARLVDVRYDDIYGFPSFLHFDPDRTIAGDEFNYTISMFDVAPSQ